MRRKPLQFVIASIACLFIWVAGVPVSTQSAARDWYVTPTGTGTGALSSPMSLAKALSSTSPAQAGDTIWLRGGKYNSAYSSVLSGTASAPIVVRGYPGERATLDANNSAARSAGAALKIGGANVVFRDFEVTSSDAGRTDQNTGYGNFPSGIDINASQNIKLVNLVVHDMPGKGIGAWTENTGAEIYGCLIYYNGMSDHDHGIYLQNQTGTKLLRDNIIFDQASHGIHGYGSTDAFIDNITIEGNTVFDNGYLIGESSRNILLGGLIVAHNPVVKSNYTYLRGSQSNSNIGYSAGTANAVVTGNYWIAGNAAVHLILNSGATVNGNVFAGPLDPSDSATRWPSNTYTAAKPTAGQTVLVRPNQDQIGRANLTVYNWSKAASVSANLAGTGLVAGDGFEIRDAMNFYGTPVLTGLYTGAAVTLPMTGLTPSMPVASSLAAPVHPGPVFGAFIVLKTSDVAGSSDNAAPSVSVTAPTAGQALSGTATLTATASDDVGVTSVQFQVDGSPVGPQLTAAPYTTTWNTTPASNGNHSVTAVARDAAGHQTTSAAVVVAVNNTTDKAPSVSVTAPASGASVAGNVTLSASATDDIGVAGVTFAVDGVQVGAEDTSAPYSATWATSGVANGTHTVTAIARDTASHQTTSTGVVVTVNNVIDNDPSVSVTAPSPGASVAGSVTLAATASDDIGIAGVSFAVDGVQVGAEDTSSPYSATWATTGVANGTHTVTAIARDTASHRTTSTGVVVTVNNVIDNDPSVSVTAPSSGASVAGSVTLAATASDDIGIAGVTFAVDGVQVGAEDTSAPYSATWATSGVANGTHTVAAIARDTASHRTTSSGVIVTVNNVTDNAPSVSVTAPSSGASVAGSVTLAATASDDIGVAGVTFAVDGVQVGAEDTAAPYSATWATSGLANGTHTVTASARDTAGHRTTSAGVVVTVNNVTDNDPSVSVTAPSSGASVAGSVTLAATATDDIGVAGVTFAVDGVQVGAEDTAAPYSATWATSGLANGTHTVTASARDTAGHRTTSAGVVVTVNNVTDNDPSVSVTAPSPGASVAGSVTLAATASDDIGVAGVTFAVDGVQVGAEDTASPYSATWATSGLANGTHTVTASARDTAGHRTTSTGVVVTVNNVTDNDPSVSVTAPSPGASVAGSVTLAATASDDIGVAGVTFAVDGVQVGAEDTASPYSATWATSGLANGTHTVTASARDTAGHRTTSAGVVVTVNNVTDNDPSVSVTAPTPGAAVAGSVTLAAAASDDVGVAGVTFAVDGVQVGVEDTSAPYNTSWVTTSAGNGNHSLTATARDTAGHRTTSVPLAVSVNNAADTDAPPSVAVTAPAPGQTVSSSVQLAAIASDDKGIAGVQFQVDGKNTGSEDTSAPYSVTWDAPGMGKGTHVVTAIARDTAGQRTTSAAISFTVGGGSSTSSSSVRINIEAEAGDIQSPMTTYRDPKASGRYYVSSPTADAGKVSYTLQIPSDGRYVIWARVVGATDTRDSFVVLVDGTDADTFDVAENRWSSSWQWTQLNGRAGGAPLTLNPRIVNLTAGQHVLTFAARDADTLLDAIIVTNDVTFVPR